MNSKFFFTTLSAISALSLSHGNAAVLAKWTFETSSPATAGPHAAEAGSGNAIGFHAATSTYSSPTGNGSTRSFSSNTWAVGDYVQFTTSSTGETGITISFDQVSSSTGPRDFGISYSTDGTTFTPTGITYTVFQNSISTTNAFSFGTWSSTTPNSSYSYSYDLSAVTALDNQAAIYFRLVLGSTARPDGGTLASTGTNRVDNFTIATVPEPSAALLGAIGLIGIFRRRR